MITEPSTSHWFPRLWPFSRKPEAAPVRFIVATRQESAKARYDRAMVERQLGIAVARLSPDEKAAAVARAKTGGVRRVRGSGGAAA